MANHKLHPYVAMVVGEQAGVGFRCFYKRTDIAERDAMLTGGTITDLRTLERRVWVMRRRGWQPV